MGMPWGLGRPYPPPPHPYRDVEDLVVGFEARAAAVRPLLPPGVEPDGDPVPCQAKLRRVPFSVHGPYREAYIAPTVRFGGVRYRFVALIWTDSEVPLVAGREIWGYPKKLARIETWEGAGSETLAGSVERAGIRLLTLSMVPDRQAEPPAGAGLPALSLKLVPDADGVRPALAQLVALEGHVHVHRAADGSAFRFEGRGALAVGDGAAADPAGAFAPVRISGASFARIDFAHEAGRVVHDYLKEG
jgi:acetoacetate decarboxylase